MRCRDGPVVDEPSTAVANEVRLSLSSSTLRLKSWKVGPCDSSVVRDSVFGQGTGI